MRTEYFFILITLFSLSMPSLAEDPRDEGDPRNGAVPVSGGAINIEVTGAVPAAEAPAPEPAGPITGPLSNTEVRIGRLGIENLLVVGGGAPPPAQVYRHGKLVVGEVLATASETGSENIYQVRIFRPSADETGEDTSMMELPQTFSLTESQIRALMTQAAADQADLALSNVVAQRFPSQQVDCSNYGTFSDETSYRDQARARAAGPPSPPVPPERYERGTRSPSARSPSYGGDNISPAHFASGRATSVGDGSGLINMRESDPNASRQTPGCEALTATPEEREENPDLEMNNENLTRCIEGIQDFILQGVSQPPSASDRALVFRRLFDLPNHEQEFAAAIFTVDGEAGHHARENPMEGVMVLKVLSNRRDNANGIESELQACRDNFSDPAERATCFGDANEESTFNLLDVALDRLQFSMYNSGEGGNWTSKFGHKRSGQFDDAINSFIAYEGMEEWNINGGRGNATIHGIYHYHTPGVNPAWRDNSLMLNISGRHETLGDLEATSAHVFYYNHDNGGNSSGDGWYRNVRHEFRSFPQ